ncbi:GlcNAc-PI de-N-acetylase [Dialister histaminiformans]|uniref:GlcNAc-PI de-N-acetylase n=1 Tax=Allisonella histaminiformans TaxID=209880 RepID=A0A1G5WB97_9FIRM|nr:PIG-L family deacetylase [Allisonella histaminiformans]SDA55026.1 GlcNAc-PI de-N-acetylase [Allisonella histaminiformans]
MSAQGKNNGLFSFFEGLDESSRTLMVIIPHEDDEINLAGTVIYHARHLGIRVICVFTTNGDWKYRGLVRMKEAIQALSLLGVPEKDIVFLGYPDGGVHGERNVFVSGRKEALAGRDGRRETYGMDTHADFAMQYRGKHQAYTWNGLVQDIKDVILRDKPAMILATDFDSHPDHRLCYLGFLHAMNSILHTCHDYRPVVLMGFCYSTGFEGRKDFYGPHLLSSVINTDQLWNKAYETDNPVYEWDQRIRFPVEEACRSWLKQNIIYKALCCHMSQKASTRAIRLINGDQVFWLRRTDNRIYEGKVSVSSGNGDYLHDFMMMNTEHITDKHPAMENYLWIPDAEDREKWCRCDFDTPQDIEAVAFYGNMDDENQVLKGRLTFSTGYSCMTGPFRKQGQETLITVPRQSGVTWVKFEILESKGQGAGISEWEILENTRLPLSIIQICINNHFAYDWAIWPGEKPEISAYTYGVQGQVKWYSDGQPATEESINKQLQHLEKRLVIRVESEDNPGLWSEAVFVPADRSFRIRHHMRMMRDKAGVWWRRQMDKRPHHQLKKIKSEKEYDKKFLPRG